MKGKDRIMKDIKTNNKNLNDTIKVNKVREKKVHVNREIDEEVHEKNIFTIESKNINIENAKSFKINLREKKKLRSKYSKQILDGDIISTKNVFPNTDEYAIELVDVKKIYLTGNIVTPVLKGIDLKIKRSKFVVILGPSGSGKTTLLNTISGLDEVSDGDVYVVGHNLSLLKDSHLTLFRRNNIGFIFQQYNLLSNLTSRENAEVGENLCSNKENRLSIEEIFETIGMSEQINKYPHQMSGGQQQRVSIARALAKNPEILFGDEPTGALDEEMGRKVLEILIDVNKKFKTTVIVVTHNSNIAEVADTVIHVKNGLIDFIKENPNPKRPSEIDWA
ncbi:ABC transporter ATP-binding protein [Spiroplasma endosymbiont of Aspidapion aeneum]|uniref:ABC transporter ATP-binding protein n=1 Tax=Spiroplasma endosymbiont of Aspidapion aeneum TaxID=3066276 RepID=UPI00313E9DEC